MCRTIFSLAAFLQVVQSVHVITDLARRTGGNETANQTAHRPVSHAEVTAMEINASSRVMQMDAAHEPPPALEPATNLTNASSRARADAAQASAKEAIHHMNEAKRSLTVTQNNSNMTMSIHGKIMAVADRLKEKYGKQQVHDQGGELQVELDAPVKSKFWLSIISTLCLGLFGVDRCFMGQTVLGVIKGLTLGGLGFWFALDGLVIGLNCLFWYESIDVLGFRARFPMEEVGYAFWITLLGCVIWCIWNSFGVRTALTYKR